MLNDKEQEIKKLKDEIQVQEKVLKEKHASDLQILWKEYNLKLELLTTDFDQMMKDNHWMKREIQNF